MKAMILAAGLGQRMRPLTDHLPKPLLQVGGKSLLDWHLEKIQASGINQVIINLSYLGHKIRDALANRYPQISIIFSEENEPLETGGALLHAMDLLGDEKFLLVNGDVWCDIHYDKFIHRGLSKSQSGHLLLVPNPEFHPEGDFSLNEKAFIVEKKTNESYTFAGISLLSPDLIKNYPHKRRKFPLAEVFRTAIQQQQLTGEIFCGNWSDVGTPERLNQLNQFLSQQQMSEKS
jgi:MurNAc alpha-1-phosphate uridylyltransferase